MNDALNKLHSDQKRKKRGEKEEKNKLEKFFFIFSHIFSKKWRKTLLMEIYGWVIRKVVMDP